MKKLALTFAIVLSFSLCALAQGGGMFQYGVSPDDQQEEITSAWYAMGNTQEVDNGLFGLLRTGFPGLPDHELGENQDAAPLGTGALLLIGLGAAYALKKKSKK